MKHYIFFGDSITDANHLFSKNPLGEGYLFYLSEMLASSHLSIQIHNQGHNGHTLQKLLSVYHSCKNHEIFQKYTPDLIGIQIGINDVAIYQGTGLSDSQKAQYLVEYEENIYSLLSAVRKDFSGPVFLFEPFLFPYPTEFYTWMPARQKFSVLMNKAADTFSCFFIPLQSLLVSSCPLHSFSHLTTDGVHLTQSGNHLLASLFWNYLKEFDIF